MPPPLALWAPPLALALAVAGCGGSDDDPVVENGAPSPTSTTAVPTTAVTATTLADAGIEGVEVFSVTEVAHVTGDVDYPQTPPVAGPHAAVWQNCGFYSEPVDTKAAVHSLEHGAVWVTYRPGLGEEQVELLRGLASSSYVLVSPWADDELPAPVVASAWNRQLQLPSAEDSRLTAFLASFRMGQQSPEPGAACTGGTGEPE